MAIATGLAIALGVGAVATGAAAVYSAANAPKAPNIPPAPPPANYFSYDSDGNLAGSQEWDAGKNAYIYKAAPKTAEQKADDKLRGEIRTGILYKLNASGSQSERDGRVAELRKEIETLNEREATVRDLIPAVGGKGYFSGGKLASIVNLVGKGGLEMSKAQLIKAAEDEIAAPESRSSDYRGYEEYAQTYSDALHLDVDKRYDKAVKGSRETANARGLTGSRYQVDTEAEMRSEKAGIDVDIAQQATLASQELERYDREFDLNTLNYIDAGGRADEALAIQKAGQAGSQARLGTAGVMSSYGLSNNAAIQKWEADSIRNQNFTKSMLDTSSGLAFLYGYGGGGGGGGGKSISPDYSKFSLSGGSGGSGYSLGK